MQHSLIGLRVHLGSGMALVILNKDRVRQLSQRLRRLKMAGCISGFVRMDPQFQAISLLSRAKGGDMALLLTVSNALISYRLSLRGEEYWMEFARWFSRVRSDDILRSFEEFLRVSRGNRLLRAQKIGRLRRLSSSGFFKIRNPLSQYRDLGLLWRDLQRALNARPGSKTIVFAVKMAYYVYLTAGLDPTVPKDLPIPVDLRIASISLTSGLVRVEGDDPINALISNPTVPQRGWAEVSESSGIPTPILDTILWVLGGVLHKCRCKPRMCLIATAKLLREACPEYGDAPELAMELFRDVERVKGYIPFCR